MWNILSCWKIEIGGVDTDGAISRCCIFHTTIYTMELHGWIIILAYSNIITGKANQTQIH